ncbi:uncharacterized protein LOC130362803 [Hyla sarda]|uniref:uncharacterized protein LOC130362803 n=1 Tax=Hyla sarda TaxID=327740 RepID=UPI0024C2E886|nr:uncharacterized protein LOC130362803 [Hyla sarda]XP_056423825.1 uncharacterized protein LOC130362803 [Hyla sarda]XP_056423826.1 uncharacterized protein LOC130362803 [Hyla sarda]XP_056423827.1 uncharacterized protein LOC130362803 [Hyla sarda]XP_056423828.1 uncharacterized protein LOC130362803 [Hyla sarda]
MLSPNQPAIFCVSPTPGLVQPTFSTPVPVLSPLAPAYTSVSRVPTLSPASPAQLPATLSPASPELIPAPELAEGEPATAPEVPIAPEISRVPDSPLVVLRRSQWSMQGQLPARAFMMTEWGEPRLSKHEDLRLPKKKKRTQKCYRYALLEKKRLPEDTMSY